MNTNSSRHLIGGAILLFMLATSLPLIAQVTLGSLSGTITDPSGKVVSGAKISVRNIATGQMTETQTDSAGRYNAPNLIAGDYELAVSADGFSSNLTKVIIAAGATQTADVKLAATLSLGDLGFSTAQTQGSAQDQARLDRRSHMLQVHQRLGLITLIPLTATLISGGLAGGKSTSSTDRDLHAGLGSLTAGFYFSSAYFAIFAPKVSGTKTEGPIRWHKALAWIHGPGMILTPILGAMAFNEKSQGEKVHGIAQAHGAVAIVTAGAYGAAILSVSIKSGSFSRTAHSFAAALGFGHSKPDDSDADADAYTGD